MQTLKITSTKYTPEVEFNIESHQLKISGKSTPENTFEFFEPIKNWLNEYFEESRECTFIFNIPYFNSSSSRTLYDIFDILESAQSSSIKIQWCYHEENENAQESGEEFQEDFESLNIELVVDNN